MTERRFRFGLQLHHPIPGTTWADTARRVEDAGFSTLLMPDHFEDQLAPVPALAVAAAATTELRVGALVFGNDYRHPVVVAKEMATLDVLSEGRVELGIGAGWMRSDYDRAGLAYDPPGRRIDRLVESIAVIRALFRAGPVHHQGEHYQVDGLEGLPKPVQDPLPLLIGGGGPRMLGLAAREADTVAITANLRAGEVGPDAIADSAPDAYDRKIARVREAAGDRYGEIELSSLTMHFEVTDDRRASAEGLGALFGMDPETVVQTPALLFGSIDEICETLEARRERWDFSYPVLQGHDLEPMAAVIARLRNR